MTGTTAVTALSGGYRGQIVTLIGTDATGFQLQDDDNDIELSGDAHIRLDDYEMIQLYCEDADNQEWQDIRLQNAD